MDNSADAPLARRPWGPIPRRVLGSPLTRLRYGTAALVFCAASLCASAFAADLTRIRGLHLTGNWGANRRGIKTIGKGVLYPAGTISAASVVSSESRGSFTDDTGATVTNDVAQVRLAGVTTGGITLTQAGFWIGRVVSSTNPKDPALSTIFVQFRPSLDSSLKGVSGFSRDITLSLSADSSSADLRQLSFAAGDALTYVTSVLASGPELLKQGTFSLSPPSALSKDDAIQALERFRSFALATRSEYFDFIKNENSNWLGISVAIFQESLADPTVKLRYRPPGDTSDATYTFDDADLEAFILQAKQNGLHVYLTLAFESTELAPIDRPPDPKDPTCRTVQHPVNRWNFGQPTVNVNSPNQACLNPDYWWWNPAHKDHAQNVAVFWNSYIALAVKYGALCQRLGVEIFSVGTETDNLFRSRHSTWPNSFGPELTQMATAVRAAYSGLLTYDQSYTVHTVPIDGGAGSDHLFEDMVLDIVGVSAYFELATAPVTRVLSVSELESTWDGIFRRYLQPLQARNPGKPIVFLEFGYTDDLGSPSTAGSNSGMSEPSTQGGQPTTGMQQQAHIFEAFYNVADRYGDLVRGTFVWGNKIFSSGAFSCGNIGFDLYCKPSAQTVASAYRKWRDLQPAIQPAIAGISNAASGQTGVFPGGYVSLYGTNFTPGRTDWSGSIRNGVLPTALDGVTVMMGGKPAYISALTPGQINVLAPDVGPGDIDVTVVTPTGQSAPFRTVAEPVVPAFLEWPAHQPVATHVDYTIAAGSGTFNGLKTVAARPGEVIVLWGTGFGPTNPPVPPGQTPGLNAGASTQAAVSININGAPVPVLSSAISSFPGLYQVAIRVPDFADGSYPLTACANGQTSPTTMLSISR